MKRAQGKFEVGGRYYTFQSTSDGEPIIESWRYDGFRKHPSCSSTSCDVPYHFHEFVACRGESEPEYRVRIPSLAQAERFFLTWNELRRVVTSSPGRQ
jgi:hypothetical protein